MAKHNFVFLYGQVMRDPRIYRDDDGKPLRGTCSINIIRGVRDFGDNLSHIKYDCPAIMTGDPIHVEEMATWKENDMVEIKGAITTKDINKSTTCEICKHKTVEQGNAVFVNPIYMSKRETGITREQGLALLKKRCEISNIVALVGKLTKDPEVYVAPNGLKITQYNLAVMRKYRIREDAAEIRTDFPWIKSYGKQADLDSKALKQGSKIMVDGMLQARDITRTTKCSECDHEYKWNDVALEVVPYAVEYLQDYIPIEEIIERENAILEAIANSVTA